MEIKMAKEMGMCFGVKMTLDHIDEAVKDRSRIDTLGTLVHNPQLVEKLDAQGIGVDQVIDVLIWLVLLLHHEIIPPQYPAPAEAASVAACRCECGF